MNQTFRLAESLKATEKKAQNQIFLNKKRDRLHDVSGL